MKLFNKEEDSLYLTKKQWCKIFLSLSIMTLVLYTVAMIFSLLGSNYFILDFQNAQMDRIEKFLTDLHIMPALYLVFTTAEFCIVISFVLKKFPKWYYILSFYVVRLLIAIFVGNVSDAFNVLYPFIFHFTVPIIDQLIETKKVSIKKYLFQILRLAIAFGFVALLQAMIFIIKAGYFDGQNHIMYLSTNFIYSIEYYIALSVILFTILLIYREKGDSKQWAISLQAGYSSQISTTNSQKSTPKKKLTKTQRNKVRLLYFKLYLSQFGAFLLVMILPFVLGKVFEFLVMYTSFCVARYILGFKYSLHYKKESLCITVGVIVFGILSLAVPFFYVVMVLAIVLGVALAILLHLSYKYKGMFLFSKVAKPDKFALLYTYFDGNLEKDYVKMRCLYRGLDKFQTDLIIEFTSGEKLSYMAKIHHYSHRMLIYKLDEAIKKLVN